MNLWHHVPIGDDAPDTFTAVVEVPLGSRIKYELDKQLGLLRVSYALNPPVLYPGNYGFIPQTLDEDGDPLDLLVIMRDPVNPLTLLHARPIGVVHMEDENQRDDKILCVLVDDPVYAEYADFDDLPDYERKNLTWFFEEYQDANHAAVEVAGVSGVKDACQVITDCRARYLERFGQGAA